MTETTHDFGDGKGPVPAHKHPNGGGWVADTAHVAATAHVGYGAQVYGYACVYGRAWICGNARVCGDARLCGDARVYGNAWVGGDAHVYGYAQVGGNVRVYGNAQVYGDAQVFGGARVQGKITSGAHEVSPPQVIRSDGYVFSAWREGDKIRVTAGCRDFKTLKEAAEHWRTTRGGTPLGDETFRILRYLKASLV